VRREISQEKKKPEKGGEDPNLRVGENGGGPNSWNCAKKTRRRVMVTVEEIEPGGEL